MYVYNDYFINGQKLSVRLWFTLNLVAYFPGRCLYNRPIVWSDPSIKTSIIEITYNMLRYESGVSATSLDGR